MNPTALYIQMKVRLWGHWAREQAHQPARAGLTALVMGGIWVALYLMFASGFRYTQLVYYLDVYLISGLFAVFLLMVMLLLVLSSVVLTHYGLYQATEAALLMQLPLAPERTALYRSFELSLMNSLGALYLITPPLWAYVVVEEVPPAQAVLTVALLPPFLVIPNCIGAVVTVLLRRVAGQIPSRTLVVGGMLLLLATFFALLTTFNFGEFDAHDHPVRLLNRTADTLAGPRAPFLPSFWYVEAVFSPARGYPKMAWWFGGILITVAGACLAGWAAILPWAYYPSWLADARTGTPEDAPRRTINQLAVWARRLRPLPETARTLLAKDALLFVREPVVRTQGLIMVGLLLVYFASLRSVYSGLVESPLHKTFVSAMNLAALGILLSAFASRFLLPQISLEGRKFWLLRTAPPHLSLLLAEKWGFGTMVLLALGQPLLALSNYMTSMDRVFVVASHALLLALAPILSAVCVGFGAAFPDLRGDSQHTGAAATLAFVMCIAIVVCSLALVATPYYFYILPRTLGYAAFIERLARNVVGAGLLGWGCGLGLLLLGHHRLGRAEVP